MKAVVLTKEALEAQGVLYKLTNEDKEELGLAKNRTWFSTDSILYHTSLAGVEVELTKFIKEDSVFETTNGAYVHLDWLKDSKILDKETLMINSKYYNYNLEPVEVSTCSKCGTKTKELHKGMCKSCFCETHNKKNSYSYKPNPRFIGEQLTGDKGNPVWYGIELEMSVADRLSLAYFKANHSPDESVLYFKSDSSIYCGSDIEDTVEVVTHPHSFKELMSASWVDNLPSIKFSKDKEQYTKNGCHVHISNTAFKDNAHYAKWYFFFYSLANGFLQGLAGRTCTQYCKNIKYGRLSSKELKREENDRAVIINENNEKTREVRVFATTNDPITLRRYIQLIEGTLKYSKYAKETLNWDDFYGYITKYSDKYNYLVEYINGASFTKPKTLKVNLSKFKVASFYDIPTDCLGNIIQCYCNGSKYEVHSLRIDFANDLVFLNGRGTGFHFSEITEVTYEN